MKQYQFTVTDSQNKKFSSGLFEKNFPIATMKVNGKPGKKITVTWNGKIFTITGK